MKKVIIFKIVGASPLQSQVIRKSCRQNRWFSGTFWEKMLSHGQTVHFRPHSVIYHLKAMHHSFKMSYLEPILVHPVRRQNFAGKSDSTFYNIWDLVVYKYQYVQIYKYQCVQICANINMQIYKYQHVQIVKLVGNRYICRQLKQRSSTAKLIPGQFDTVMKQLICSKYFQR